MPVNSFRSIVALGLLILGLAGCAFKKEDGNDELKNRSVDELARELQEKEQERTKKELLSMDEISFEVIEEKEIHHYQIAIKYPQRDGVRIFISHNGATVDNLQSGIRIPSLSGKTHTFTITAYNSLGSPLISANKVVAVPQDITVLAPLELDRDTVLEGGRILFKKDSFIKTKGHLLTVHAKKLIVEPDFLIFTFSPDEKWTDTKFLSGGSISIMALEATGFLSIKLQGASGENGRSGDELLLKNPAMLIPTSNLHGRAGTDGRVGQEPCFEVKRSMCGKILTCEVHPTNGEDGKTGPQGLHGENGHDGGDTGNLFIKIENERNFQLQLELNPGKAGRPGKGGQGGPGGQGGKAGKQSHPTCRAALDGKAGAQGPVGNDGKAGSPGKLGTIELNGLKNVRIHK